MRLSKNCFLILRNVKGKRGEYKSYRFAPLFICTSAHKNAVRALARTANCFTVYLFYDAGVSVA